MGLFGGNQRRMTEWNAKCDGISGLNTELDVIFLAVLFQVCSSYLHIQLKFARANWQVSFEFSVKGSGFYFSRFN